jgi:hypothetical protein
MPEKDPGTGGLKEAEKVLRVILPPRDDAPAVVEPREQTFDLPAARVRRTHRPSWVRTRRSLPELKAPMARLIRRIPGRQVAPRRAGPQDPEHAVQHRPRRPPRSPAAVGATPRPKNRFENGPLLVGQVHAEGTTLVGLS